MPRRAFILLILHTVSAEILTPPYFNLALGKHITATATCGDEGPDLYCKLVGANANDDEHVIQGQVCDYCDATNETKKHPPEYAVDGMETRWQSPPLSRGMKYNEVNLTIDLGQEFHVAYVFVRMGNSPRPGLWALEKSTDYGKTFKPWQYFSDSPLDCERYFGKESLNPITRDDSVICSTEYSKIVPLEGGEIPISLLNSRPSANKYFNSSVLQEWTRATNVRLRLMRTKNLLGHLMSVARQDPTVTRRYFYSIKDISIGGRCMCNGHANDCYPGDSKSESNILVCRCQHNTCGSQCAKCCPGFEQKKWRISQNWDRFECEPCNCHNHTTECSYDPEIDEKHLSLDIHGRYEGGGVCKNCQHNTEGINCNKCRPTFYRPYGKKWDDIDVCEPCQCDLLKSTGNCAEETGLCECRKEFQPPYCNSCAYGYFDYPDCKPCTCNLNGTDGQHCTPVDGTCPCKYNYAGHSCEICADGYYSPECKNCECNMVGAVSTVCDKDSGNCTCKSKYSGRTCNECEAGYYNYPSCNSCNCDVSGTQASICDDVTGQCICKDGFGGSRCDQCLSGYYMQVKGRERHCAPCECSPTGSTSKSCSADGKCNCLVNFGGSRCDQCSPGYYQFPECTPCKCDVSGSIGSTCDDQGACHCKPNFQGVKCDTCMESFYNYPACEECNCDPKGVVASFAGCGSVPAGELCKCKERVQGRICNDCKPLYWNLQDYNPVGCEDCNCNVTGTLGGLGACDTKTGACACKLNVDGRQCSRCRDGFRQLQPGNTLGCTECDCDVGGSVDNNCDKITGQCTCHSRVEGLKCTRPIQAHYFPTLHQFRYEVEEGLTQSGPVRYRNSEEVFPGHSWKGYVVFSLLQNEVINIVHISKSSFYRVVMKYANPLPDPVVATIVITPENPNDNEQTFQVLFKPTAEPQLVTVAGEKGNAPAPLVMNPGNWTFTIKTTKEVMIDYFVLIPEPYYEATVLAKPVERPCAPGDADLCREFAYPSLAGRPAVGWGGLAIPVTAYIDDPVQLKELKVTSSDIPILGSDPNTFEYNMEIEPNGPYVLVIEYVTPIGHGDKGDNPTKEPGKLNVRFKSGDVESQGIMNVDDCNFTVPCRQVVIDESTKAFVVDVLQPNNVVYLEAAPNTVVGIRSITAVPLPEWHLAYITPRPYCLRRGGKCAPAVFTSAEYSKKVEIESAPNAPQVPRPPILDNSTAVVYLGPGSEPVTLEARVPNAGQYMFVLHYYQPDHPVSKIDVTLTAEGRQYPASVALDHCPSNSGCRALLTLAGDSVPIADNYTVQIQNANGKAVWLDYILVVASEEFQDSVLRESNTLDYTREFISKCANNHYYINPNTTGFCRDAVFSITAEYNSGTLKCTCDVEGSTDLECETFGGQCNCRDNVIGRACTSCRPGYYGFPNCRPCRCPETAICDDDGNCICPKNVQGSNCDTCKPLTFNYDPYRGCDDCNCHALGVRSTLQCDPQSGDCGCKPNVIGRTCDHCVPGHYNFPYCEQCTCSLEGTTELVCDQETAQCFCKKNVRGQACDTCKEEYFNLQASNADGCTKCFCFGKTTRCSSAYLSWAEITGMKDWYLVNVELNKTVNIFPHSAPSQVNDTIIGATLSDDAREAAPVYFAAPDYYLGKRLTSYGGYLTYSIFHTSRDTGRPIPAADVIIASHLGYMFHYSIEQPPPLISWRHRVALTDEEFVEADGSSVARERLMAALVNVTGIYIRASYWSDAVTTRLMDVSLDVGVEQYSSEDQRALSVEECLCPKAYKGLSCEQCSAGHYRLSSGPHAGFCVPCECHGHSNQCDVNTGVCLECGDNTMGDHCEECLPGYHGDATVQACLICACPRPVPSNNFALGCELSGNGSLISCDCKPGYGGPRCEFCVNGYYGVPSEIGDYCKPCNCSGNIDPRDPLSCDSINGDCLKCVNNTAGEACALCAPGFYGDAVLHKNCTACSCDEYGMDHCDALTGKCVCREGVAGARCDSCLPDHWGLATGAGCRPCECGPASEDTQCDLNTGQCRCRKGVTGKRCDQCAAGYWNYTKEGCDHCNCNTGYSVGFMCSATGQCQCLPGVIGEKCNRCPERWVLIPQEGCLECDSCTDALIYSVEDLSGRLANETSEFKNKADSFFTTQRLHYIGDRTVKLRPLVASVTGVDVKEASEAVNTLETSAKKLLRSAEFAATDSEKQITRAGELSTDADKLLSVVREGGRAAQAAVQHVADLATGLELSQQPRVDSALAEARQIKEDLAAKNFTARKKDAFSILTNATEQQERMNLFVLPVNEQAKRFEGQKNASRQLRSKMDAMYEYTDLAQHGASAAEDLNRKNKQSKFGTKVQSVTDLNAAAMMDLIDAGHDIKNATELKSAAEALLAPSPGLVTEEMEAALKRLSDDIPELLETRRAAEVHAAELSEQANRLREVAERDNNTRTQHAYTAASAYSDIVHEIGGAKKAADDAERDANIARDKKLHELVEPSLNKSQQLTSRAAAALQSVEGGLAPNQTRAEQALQLASQTIAHLDELNKVLMVTLRPVPEFSLDDETAKAETVDGKVKTTKAVITELGDQLAASKDRARMLPKQADEAKKTKDRTEDFLNDIDGTRLKLAKEYEGLSMKQVDFERRRAEADDRLKRVRDLVEQARTVVDRIKVGVNYNSRTTLQPRLPEAVDEMSTSTHVSAYFRTKKNDGFILYLGNPPNAGTKSVDFMVIGVQNGYPYLLMDIGDGAETGRDPVRVGSDKFVADDRWYQVIVDRVGRNVKLSIREALDDGKEKIHATEAVLPGQHTIFNLDRKKSKLFVGGAPSDAKLQGVSYPAFEGQIEELMIGNTPVGLWNFETGSHLEGARERDKFISTSTAPQEYRFNGEGHVTMPGRGYLAPQKNNVVLFFKTYAKDGLIYLVGDERSFFSVQMQDGYVFLQVSLGNPEDLVIIGTSKTYNDGKWHKLVAARFKDDCSLTVDQESLRNVSKSGGIEIPSVDTMTFGGGNKGILQVKKEGFDGCMRQVSVEAVNVDLSQNAIESIGVSLGCQFSSLVSLSGVESFLRYANITSHKPQLTLKFKTDAPDGLIFDYVNRLQTTISQESLSLAIVKGKLVVMTHKDSLDTGAHTYNDSQWHVVTVSHTNALRLRVDDTDQFSSDASPEPLNIMEGVLLIGGMDSQYVVSGKVASKVPFRGCVADATIDGQVLNLLRPVNLTGVTFGRCGARVSTGARLDTDGWPRPKNEDVLPIPTEEENQPEVRGDVPPTEAPPVTSRVAPASAPAPPATPAPLPATPRPAPRPQTGCALAYDPYYTVGDPTEGYRFGTHNESRIEYSKLPGRQTDGLDLAVTFRTFDQQGGVVFYAATGNQFLAIYMKGGHLHFTFNCGDSTASLVSNIPYNDMEWYTVTVIRTSGNGKMTVGSEVLETSVRCDNPAALSPPYFYGGLRRYTQDMNEHLSGFRQPFKGCLKNLKMNGHLVTSELARVNALRCTDHIEDGVYFGPTTNSTSNYLKLRDTYKVGLSIAVTMEIKPRNSTGLLLSVHGRKDFLILELLENEVVANVENGRGPFHASYKLGNKVSLCDGKWHKIQVVKSRHVVSVGVDGHFSDAGIGVSGSTDTRSALYIGGHERDVSKVKGVRSKRGFTGCIRKISIKDTPVDIQLSAAGRDTHIGVCPTD